MELCIEVRSEELGFGTDRVTDLIVDGVSLVERFGGAGMAPIHVLYPSCRLVASEAHFAEGPEGWRTVEFAANTHAAHGRRPPMAAGHWRPHGHGEPGPE